MHRSSFKRFFTLFSLYFFVTILSRLDRIDSALIKANSRPSNESTSLLLVVSFDGFSPHYLNQNMTPNIQYFRQQGTSTSHLKNVFPTKTFPNHHSIATGLFPAEHGVLGAEVYDSDQGKLEYSRQLYEYDDKVIPIWTLNEIQGGKSGCMQWPGSDFNYTSHEIGCSFLEKINLTFPSSWEKRVDKSLEWFKQGANLVMMYIEEPDRTGHMVGINSTKEKGIISQLDNLTKYIERQVYEHNLHDQLNIVILSDHGMINTKPKYFINLTQWLPSNKEDFYGRSPVLQIYPKTVEVDQLYDILLNVSLTEKTFKVYRNKDIPERWHYRNERRTGPLTVVAEPPYAFQDMWEVVQWYKDNYNITVTNESEFGIHGYDNNLPSMNSLFMAKGPAIKQHHTVPPFDTVDLFHLFCEILNIKPPIISGNRDNIIDILTNQSPPSSFLSLQYIILISALVLLVLFVSMAGVVVVRRRGRENRQTVPPYLYDEPDWVVGRASGASGLPEEHQKLLEITPPKPETSDLSI